MKYFYCLRPNSYPQKNRRMRRIVSVWVLRPQFKFNTWNVQICGLQIAYEKMSPRPRVIIGVHFYTSLGKTGGWGSNLLSNYACSQNITASSLFACLSILMDLMNTLIQSLLFDKYGKFANGKPLKNLVVWLLPVTNRERKRIILYRLAS